MLRRPTAARRSLKFKCRRSRSPRPRKPATRSAASERRGQAAKPATPRAALDRRAPRAPSASDHPRAPNGLRRRPKARPQLRSHRADHRNRHLAKCHTSSLRRPRTRSNGQTRTFQKQKNRPPPQRRHALRVLLLLFHDLCIYSSTSTTNADATARPIRRREVQTEKLEDAPPATASSPRNQAPRAPIRMLLTPTGDAAARWSRAQLQREDRTHRRRPEIEGTLPLCELHLRTRIASSSYFREVFGLIQSGVTTCKVSFRWKKTEICRLGDSYSAGPGPRCSSKGRKRTLLSQPVAYPN